MKSQSEVVLKHLKSGPITPLEAIQQYGILRLGARIYDLKKAGHKIIKKLVEVKDRHGSPCYVAQYHLVQQEALHDTHELSFNNNHG